MWSGAVVCPQAIPHTFTKHFVYVKCHVRMKARGYSRCLLGALSRNWTGGYSAVHNVLCLEGEVFKPHWGYGLVTVLEAVSFGLRAGRWIAGRSQTSETHDSCQRLLGTLTRKHIVKDHFCPSLNEVLLFLNYWILLLVGMPFICFWQPCSSATPGSVILQTRVFWFCKRSSFPSEVSERGWMGGSV